MATNYHRGLDYLENLGVKEVWAFERAAEEITDKKGGKPKLKEKAVPITEFRASLRINP